MPGARELAMLRDPRNSTETIVGMLCGSTEAGVLLAKDILHGLTHTRFNGVVMVCAEAQRSPEHPAARSFLRFIIRVISKLERNGPKKLSVRGKAAWWGKQHVNRVMSDAELDLLMADKEVNAELHGLPRPKRWRVRRQYVRKLNAQGRHQQRGLAMDIDRCSRTVGRYARAAKLLCLFKSWQPKAGAEDAVMPRVGSWAYPELTTLRELPERLLERLRRWWGERTKAKKTPRPRVAGEPSRVLERLTSAPRGPPASGLAAAQPSEDATLAAELGLSLTELDDFEQLCGRL